MVTFVIQAQKIGVGADVMYNFQTESYGAGVRVNIWPNHRLSFVPQASYYPGFNKIHEYYIGLGLEYKVFRLKNYNFYAIGHGAFNSWLNYNESSMKNAHLNNWNFEAGIGVTNDKCLRPFMEYRYNIKFMETHLRIGLLYIFGCSPGQRKKGGGGKFKICPAYDL